jgi:hypothetical protein
MSQQTSGDLTPPSDPGEQPSNGTLTPSSDPGEQPSNGTLTPSSDQGEQPSNGNLTPQSDPSEKPSSPLKTRSGKLARRILLSIWEPIDVFFGALLGSLWRPLYLNIQDAIVLALALQIPGLLGKLIIGKDFSSFDVCLKENGLGVSKYACFLIVSSDFVLWIVLAGRILGRSFVEIRGAIRRLIQSITGR